jgi:Lrp/AsnC family transcriptional regulator for asnA, asnC and gidA
VARKGSRGANAAADEDPAEPVDVVADPGQLGKARAVDQTDLALITELQHDGRASYAALARAVGLSEAAVRQRVQRLLENRTMQIVAVTDPMTVNLARQAMVGVRAEGDTREVAARLAELPEVDYVVLCAGTFDILCEITCEDDEQLLELLNGAVRSVPGVRETETFIYLALTKQTYTWGRR